ncbi:MAG: glutamate--tRNA ligase [Candidatus Marinimicrobia bacterium]|nr:glutamate--tRNA ligase [Candidatus Neomarinimicrobiota bacterium]MCF7827358.1 glutamate--tRNA ligase [Candidatus Neomarinimicrobiota bacterium]MCF7881409.1 glutamate--tRNA ligase [Candidatus Neomarinimicrobiota bacterium]
MTAPEQETRVRFAPSPTGYLHVGGARTAIFNWLYARQHQGKFLVRIEDTDVERSDPKMVENILESMEWLGLAADEEIVYQSDNQGAHRSAVDALLETGKAYRCFCTPEELKRKRLAAGEKDQESYQYDGTCRNLSNEEIQEHLESENPYAVRFRVEQGWINFKDRVYKKISVNTEEIDDFIIQRRDGTPVYQLAVVVDDANMGITNVIRGKDHLSNTPKQILLYKALDYPVPKFAHLPLILGSDGKRLSKRHGATAVNEYRDKGYLRPAMLNYLALLGWTPKGNQEILLPDELIEQFDLLRVSKAEAAFDEKKLRWVNEQHISKADTAELLPLVKRELAEEQIIAGDGANSEYLTEVITLLKSRMKTISDFGEYGRYFWNAPAEFDREAVEKFWPNNTVNNRMKVWLGEAKEIEPWNPEEIEKVLRDTADSLDVGAGKLIHPTRLAITGMGVSPGIFQVIELIGQDQLISRIEYALENLPL